MLKQVEIVRRGMKGWAGEGGSEEILDFPSVASVRSFLSLSELGEETKELPRCFRGLGVKFYINFMCF